MKTFKRTLALGLRRLVRGDRFSVHGVELDVPIEIDQEVRYTLARGRPYETEEAHLVQRYLKPDMNVLEFGGSIGVVSCLTRTRIGRNAHQIIVEANPQLARVCESECSANSKNGHSERATKSD